MGYVFVMTVIVALMLGFAAGLLTFKRSCQWCPVCGAVKSCLECTARSAPALTTTQRPPDAGTSSAREAETTVNAGGERRGRNAST